MTTDTPNQGRHARVQRLRDLLTESQVSRLRHFSELRPTVDLYRCMPFKDGSLFADLSAWIEEALPKLMAYAPCRQLVERLRTLYEDVSGNTALSAVTAAQRLLAFDNGDLPGEALDLVADATRRLNYYAWCLGSDRAAAQVAVTVADIMKPVSHNNELALADLNATRLQAVMNPLVTYAWQPKARDKGHAAAMQMLVGMGDLAHDVLRARKTLTPEQGQEKRRELGKAIRTLLDNAAGEVQCDVYQVLPEPEVQEPAQPGHVVLGSVDHLPNHRDSPRQHHERFANVPLRCVPAPDPSAMADALVARYPWAKAAVRRVCGMLVGQRHAVFRNPVLFLGSQGCGKTALMRDIGSMMGVPVTVFGCGGVADAGFGGTSRQYISARPSVPAQTMFQASTATVLVGLDELEKATHGSHNGSMRDSLLGMIEPSMRAGHWDVCLETNVDLSMVSFFATANSDAPLRGPLLDRFTVVRIPDPRREDLDVIVRGLLDQERARSGLDPRFTPDLDETEMRVLRGSWKGGSIRPLARAVEQLLALRSSPRLAH